MTKQELIQKFEENISRAREIYDRGEQHQMRMQEVIAQMEEQLKNFKKKD
jgi:predicted Zn-dependent protease